MADFNKGTEIMEGLLLSQYAKSENLKEYFGAFFDEMDELFGQVEEVYLGRLLEHAIGTQLDIIGVILGQSRSVPLRATDKWFGFDDDGVANPALNAYKMADDATPEDGGIFQDENNIFNITPLGDGLYRRVLLAKALCNTQTPSGNNFGYKVVTTLLGRVPQKMQFRSNQEQTPSAITTNQHVQLELSAVDTDAVDESIIEYFAFNFIPLGTTFTVART